MKELPWYQALTWVVPGWHLGCYVASHICGPGAEHGRFFQSIVKIDTRENLRISKQSIIKEWKRLEVIL